jgi:hypothetical protein
MSWTRAPVADALVSMFGAATTAFVHDRPPEIINPPAVIVSRTVQEMYNTIAFGVDDVELPIVIAGGVESDNAIDALKATCRAAVDADPTLQGSVKLATAGMARNWRNMTGAGGIQLLLVELILTIQM